MKKETKENPKTSNPVSKEVSYHKGLASVFPSNPSAKEIRYQGMAEYGHAQVLESVTDSNGTRTVRYKGWFEDGVGGDPEDRKFYIDYVIKGNSIHANIQNLDKIVKTKTNTLRSIIPNQIVLQAPLEINHSWTQEFKYDPLVEYPSGEYGTKAKTLKAVHTITKIDGNKGNPIYTVETVVKGVDGYYKNTYKEVKTWEKEKGLTSFMRSIPVYDGFEETDEDADNLLMFGYGIVPF